MFIEVVMAAKQNLNPLFVEHGKELLALLRKVVPTLEFIPIFVMLCEGDRGMMHCDYLKFLILCFVQFPLQPCRFIRI